MQPKSGGHIFEPVAEQHGSGGAKPAAPGKVTVTVDMTTGGRRRVTLAADQVRGHTPAEILEAGLAALERQGTSLLPADPQEREEALINMAFARNARSLLSRPGAALEMRMGSSQAGIPVRGSTLRLQAVTDLRFDLGQDLSGGGSRERD